MDVHLYSIVALHGWEKRASMQIKPLRSSNIEGNTSFYFFYISTFHCLIKKKDIFILMQSRINRE